MKLEVVFRNDHFIILDKPAQVLSVPSRQGDKDLRPCLGFDLQKQINKQVFPVHRLDFEVQGLIMYALNRDSHRAGTSWFENKIIQKTYCAQTYPINSGPTEFKLNQEMIWKCRILRGKKRAYEAIHGKESITIAKLTNIALSGVFHWELNPVTGRSHQLRYELFRHHHPIIGDVLYGSDRLFESQAIALRSFKIDFSKISDRTKFDLPEKIETKKFAIM